MRILFPSEPFNPRCADPSFEDEYGAARDVGWQCSLYDHDAVVAGDAESAVRRLHADENDVFILRGWMMTGEQYRALCKAVAELGSLLVTQPADYVNAHYIPSWYPHVREHTAKTDWIEGDDVDAAWELYQGFSAKDAVIKDWVKSAKYRWKDGCFIPAGTSEDRFREIFAVFREERGDLFNKGVVIREFLPFVERGGKIADLPIIEEHRMFFWDGGLLCAGPNAPVKNIWWQIMTQRIGVPFMSMDVAMLEDGTWKIVECGDGGVSGLPQDIEPFRFYAALWNKVHTNER